MVFGLPGWLLASVSFLLGVVIVIESVEVFVEHVADAAVGLGVSGFFLAVVLAGVDLENAVLALAAVVGRLPDVAVGIVFGEALFVLGVAVGLAGVVSPFETTVPRPYLLVALASPALFLALSLDGVLSRLDGAVLSLAFVPLLGAVYALERNAGTQYLSAEEVRRLDDGESATDDGAETDGEEEDLVEELIEGVVERVVGAENEALARLVVLLLATAGMTVGSELAVLGARELLAALGVAGLAFGATVVSLVASIEELALTVEPVRRGHAHIGVGNVVGSVLFFVTVNAGVVAVVRPVTTAGSVLAVHWPFFLVALALVTGMLARGRVGRLGGAVLLGVYVAYWGANFPGVLRLLG